MPIEFSHNRERNLLLITIKGDVSDQDLLDYAHQAVDDPEIDADTNDFIDLSRVTSTAVSSLGLRRMNALLAGGGRTQNAGRMAIYAPNDMPYGMSRMFQAFRDGGPIEVRVFRELDAAQEWIGLVDP